jgi:FAD:protein FMN transferase
MNERMTRCRPLLGTFVEVTGDGEGAIDAAFEAIGRVHGLMSAHEPDSDVSRISRSAHERSVEVDPWTAAVIERALYWSKQSAGAFDVVAAGSAAIANGCLPLHAGQPMPKAAHWSWLEICGSAVKLLKPGCIDLGGIAKGYAVDRAVCAMLAQGAAFGLINAGGDMAGFGPQSWSVQVAEPETRRAIASVAISNEAIATSSIHPGGRADHLPRLAADLVSATVRAPNAMDADALAKIVLSGSPAAGACLRKAGAQAFVLTAQGTIRAVEPELQAA